MLASLADALDVLDDNQRAAHAALLHELAGLTTLPDLAALYDRLAVLVAVGGVRTFDEVTGQPTPDAELARIVAATPHEVAVGIAAALMQAGERLLVAAGAEVLVVLGMLAALAAAVPDDVGDLEL